MALLLDTNAVVWWLTDSPRLSEVARATINAEVASGRVYVSAVSGFEMALGEARGTMPSAEDFTPFVFESEFADEALPSKETILASSHKRKCGVYPEHADLTHVCSVRHWHPIP